MRQRARSEREEKLLERIIYTDGIKKIQDAITAVISGDVEIKGRDPTNALRSVAVDSSGKLRVVTT